MNWTQPICIGCYGIKFPGRVPTRVVPDLAEHEICCRCGEETHHGIYVRLDPLTVPFPKKKGNSTHARSHRS